MSLRGRLFADEAISDKLGIPKIKTDVANYYNLGIPKAHNNETTNDIHNNK